MSELKNLEFWFVVGSQTLYGVEVLEIVAKRAQEMATTLSESPFIPCKVVYK
jgi:L-arabinose isomerase